MTRRLLITGASGFIGTNLVEHLTQEGDEVLNLDLERPRNRVHDRFWRSVDLLDAAAVRSAIETFDPSHLVHLAARTDLDGATASDYPANTTGADHVLDAAASSTALQRIIIASSMLVCPNGHTPSGPTDWCPDTAYGASKAAMERSVRARHDLSAPWVLVRPTSIWGPWFGEPYRPFFETVLGGRYVHPGSRRVEKALGYVGNTCTQISAMLDDDRFDGEVVYLCDDPPYSIGEWADCIADAAGRRRPRHVPVGLLRAAARGGDAARRTGLVRHPPLTTFRLDNMLTSSRFDVSALTSLTGPLPHTLADGVRHTLNWLETGSDPTKPGV